MTVAKAPVISSATTAVANINSDLPVQARVANNRLVAAMAIPAANMAGTSPTRMAKKPPSTVKATVTIHPSPLE